MQQQLRAGRVAVDTAAKVGGGGGGRWDSSRRRVGKMDAGAAGTQLGGARDACY
jgi:hypothetical protein